MKHRNSLSVLFGLAVLIFASACVSEGHRTIETDKVESYRTNYSGPVHAISIGKFNNASPYMRGLFSEGPDRLGGQAKTILETHLAQTGRFSVLNRTNMSELAEESQLSGTAHSVTGAEVVITGEVTEFGRKTVGDRQLFGIFGRGKTQVAYAVVSLNVVEVSSSRIVYSAKGAGEYSLSDREILGTGGTSGYDSTLNGKVLDLSIREAVNNLVRGLEESRWTIGK
ncbi:MAG: curli biogenesis system outer membrane secretion channel CsgG [Planctomycetota bacterium]|jgi:curli biogenesis system outer membrane secretion channel CsgG